MGFGADHAGWDEATCAVCASGRVVLHECPDEDLSLVVDGGGTRWFRETLHYHRDGAGVIPCVKEGCDV